MEETTFFDYFTVERLFVFLLQLEMIERWISLDKEKGSQLVYLKLYYLKQLFLFYEYQFYNLNVFQTCKFRS